jgi:hypothetical protein
VIVVALVTMVMNPTFSVPGSAFIFWMSVGFLAGKSVREKTELGPEFRVPRAT